MRITMLDPSTVSQMKSVSVPTDVRDEKGTLLGYFHPVIAPENAGQHECPIDGQELPRRAREGGGHSLGDVCRDQESRK